MYELMAIAGILAATVFSYFLLRNKGISLLSLYMNLLLGAVFLLIGARLFGIISYSVYQISVSEPIGASTISSSGIVFYGGLIGLLIGFCINNSNDISKDVLSVSIPLFHSFARIGCYFAGCCYGIRSRTMGLPYPVHMPDSHRVPVQLVESAANLLIFAVLLILFLKNKRGLMPLYLAMYSVVRFANEFIRGDAVRGVIMGVSFSQIVSVVLLAVSAYMIETGKPYSPGYLDLPVRKT